MWVASSKYWKWWAVGTLGVVLAAIVAAYVLFAVLFNDTSTPIPVSDMINGFRDDGADGPTQQGLPTAGVYVYTTQGGEEVDALGGTRHDYPPETTITVTRSDCGVNVRWDALEERRESWQLCSDSGALLLGGYVTFHQFFGQPDQQRFTCEAGSQFLPGQLSEDDTWSIDCAAGSLLETTTYEVLSIAAMDVNGESVDAVRLSVKVDVSGRSQGSSEGELWLSRKSGLPLRWSETTETTSGSQIGPVHYSESLTIELTSLTPHQ